MAFHLGAGETAHAVDDHAVLPRLQAAAQAVQLRYGGGDAVRLLDAQFGGVADDGVALGEAGGHGQHRQLVDHDGNDLAAQVDALEVGR